MDHDKVDRNIQNKDTSMFDIFQRKSGEFLTEEVPNDWEHDMDDAAKIEFINEHRWELLEDLDYSNIVELIENSTIGTVRELARHGITVTGDINDL